jgi:hypothetical protein
MNADTDFCPLTFDFCPQLSAFTFPHFRHAPRPLRLIADL